MCMTKKGVMVFLFFFKKTAFFSFYQRSAAVPYCMIKENSTCNSIYQETFVRDTGTLFIANKTNTWLHLFFDKRRQPWPYRNTVHIHYYRMKEELWCKLFWYVGWFKLGYVWAVSESTFYIHFINSRFRLCTWYLPIGMQEPPLCEETFHLFWHGKVDSTYCTIKALPPVSQYYKLLRSCSDLVGRKYSSLYSD